MTCKGPCTVTGWLVRAAGSQAGVHVPASAVLGRVTSSPCLEGCVCVGIVSMYDSW